MSKYFYAVQIGEGNDWDDGSTNYEKALEIAERYMADEEFDGQEIRIACIDEEERFCEWEDVVRAGRR